MNRNIAIIGANGYIGRNLAYHLKSKGLSCDYFDLSENPIYNWMEGYTQIDIRDYKSVSKLCNNYHYIFFMSGITGTMDGFENYRSLVEVNEIGLLNLLHFIRNSSPNTIIIFPSTRLIYKGQQDKYLIEDSEKEFNTIYSINKFAGEMYLKMYSKVFNINYIIFRISVPYGNLVGNEYSYGTIGSLLNQAKNERKISIYGDGKQRRTFTHIEDVCEIFRLSINNKKIINQVYNIGGENYSILEIAYQIANKFKNSHIKNIEWLDKLVSIESGDTIFDSKKIDKILNYRYKNNFKRWLSKLDFL